MKTKHRSQNVRLRAIAMLCVGLVAWGCSSSKPSVPTNEPKLEIAAPTVRMPPAEPDSTDQAIQASAEPLVESSAVPTNADLAAAQTGPDVPAEPPQTWSAQRILALCATGPIVIDVSANIAGKSLDEAAKAATARAVAQIEKGLPRPWSWPKLLDHPLVRTGWLGNLPESNQREQLISMYNTDGDEEVDDDELGAFLTRGLARGAAFRFTDIGSAPGTMATRSPWERLDANQDSSLDKSEIANIRNVVASFDLNADRVVTFAEMQSNRATTATGTMSTSSMLDSKSAMAVGPDQKPQQVARKLLEHYTGLETVSRAQWSGWSDNQWNAFDTNGDLLINSNELEPITTVLPELHIKVQFQASNASEVFLSAKVSSESDFKWHSRLKTAGQARGTSGALGVMVVDSYTAANRDAFRARLTSALSNPQLAMLLRTQLQLGEGAFEVLDADNDDKLSDEEFQNAWEWSTAVRGSRIIGRWMLAESTWYRMADVDADNRLTEVELQQFDGFLAGLDQDEDGAIAPIEMPLTARLEIARTDDRIAAALPPKPQTANVEVGWFAASDTNDDGFVSSTEFLGSNEDFMGYDSDNDGFVSPIEAYKTQNARVQ